jgi:hypothetical protein
MARLRLGGNECVYFCILIRVLLLFIIAITFYVQALSDQGLLTASHGWQIGGLVAKFVLPQAIGNSPISWVENW